MLKQVLRERERNYVYTFYFLLTAKVCVVKLSSLFHVSPNQMKMNNCLLFYYFLAMIRKVIFVCFFILLSVIPSVMFIPFC